MVKGNLNQKFKSLGKELVLMGMHGLQMVTLSTCEKLIQGSIKLNEKIEEMESSTDEISKNDEEEAIEESSLLKKITTTVVDTVKDAGKAAFEFVCNAGSEFVGTVKDAGEAAFEFVCNAGEAAFEFVCNTGSTIVDTVKDAGEAAFEFVCNAGSTIVDAVKDAGKSVVSFTSKANTTTVDTAETIDDGVVNATSFDTLVWLNAKLVYSTDTLREINNLKLEQIKLMVANIEQYEFDVRNFEFRTLVNC